MSAPLVVSIPHRLGREEAARRLKGGLVTRRSERTRAQRRRGALGGRPHVLPRARHRSGGLGQIDVADDHVRLEVTLPWLLQRFAQMAQAAIRQRGQLLLTKKS